MTDDYQNPHAGRKFPALSRCRHWIFDLDGTLTVPAHDFERIRADLGLPADVPILEAIQTLPGAQQRRINAQLSDIESAIARRARPQPHAAQLLSALLQRSCTLGILTRNSEINALLTLEACGLSIFFTSAHIVGRESCAPKPSPEGVTLLLDRWGINAEAAVMVGDFRFDLEAGRAAGVQTVYFDPSDTRELRDYADVSVQSLADLSPAASAS